MRLLTAALCMGLLFPGGAMAQQSLRVGAGLSTESNVLAEFIAQSARNTVEGNPVCELRTGDLSETVTAMTQGSIDVFPIALDLLVRDVLKIDPPIDRVRVNAALAERGLSVSIPLGYQRKYALAVPAQLARNLKLVNISDLATNPQLRFGFSPAFRSDPIGLAALKAHGSFPSFVAVKELDIYERDASLISGRVDVIDVLTTDSVINKQRLTLLKDDANFFAGTDVVLLHRLDAPKRFPQSWLALSSLENSITEKALLEINWRVDSGSRTVPDAVEEWLSSPEPHARVESTVQIEREEVIDSAIIEAQQSSSPSFTKMTLRHLSLVLTGLLLSVVIGIPLGVWASRRSGFGKVIMAGTKLIGITPILALLALCVVLARQFGAGPALLALFVYGLWPIVTHTYLGLRNIPQDLIDAATLQNLSGMARVRVVELPLAMAAIGEGMRRCAVINVGTATIAALIGAGGYGQAIIQGIAEQDLRQMLTGALPVTVLALGIYLLFGWIARVITPIGVEPFELSEP